MSSPITQPPCSHVLPLGEGLARLDAWLGEGHPTIMGLLTPTHIDQLSDVIQWAASQKQKLVVRGRGTQAAMSAHREPLWILDTSELDVPVEEFEDSRAYWLPASATVAEMETYLRGRGCSLGVWHRLFPQQSLGGAISTALPFAWQSFYQRGVNCMAIEAIVPSGRRIETSDASRSAMGMGLRGLWNGSRGQIGVITRVLVSVEATARDSDFYVLRPENLPEACRILHSLLRQDYVPELALTGCDRQGAYLLWAQRSGSIRDTQLADTMVQYGEGRFDPHSLDAILGLYRDIQLAPTAERRSAGLRWSDMQRYCASLDGRKGAWQLSATGPQGLTYHGLRPHLRELPEPNAELAQDMQRIRAALDPEGLFHPVTEG